MSDAPVRPLRSKRLLALAGDERLVEAIRRGSEAAFEVAFERYGAGVLAFCRHMLGSREEAEDAVQHTFAAAFRDLQRDRQRRIALKPWLFTIARNRCVSVLRARREHATELTELPTEGLSEQVERRVELRELLADLRELPEEPRAALLLAEAGGLSHAEVAEVLGCEVAAVKGLVFRARNGLIERRTARETPCGEIREQLATLRGGALRRNELRHHLKHCPGCSAYREELRRQRQMLAVALPVVPTLGLKSNVMAALGIGGSAAGGSAAAGGAAAGGLAGGASAGGLGGGALGGGAALGSAAIAKVAVAGALALGGVAAGDAIVDRDADERPAPVAPAAADAPASGERGNSGLGPATAGREHGERISSERSHGQRGAERRAARSRGRGNAEGGGRATAPGQAREKGGRKAGNEGDAVRRTPPGRARAEGPRSTPPTKPQRPPKPAAPARPVTPAKPKAQVQEPAAQSQPVVIPEVAPAPVAPDTGKAKLPK